MPFLSFLLQVAGGVLILAFIAIVISSVALAIRQQWTKKPEPPASTIAEQLAQQAMQLVDVGTNRRPH